MSKRELAAAFLGNRFTPYWRFSSGARTKGLRILAYHRVLDDDPRAFPFDEELISATTEMFYRQMKFVQRHFEVISFRELAERERADRPWPERALIITFDDGYRDNYTNAWPILREVGLTATIFLTTGHIGSTELFWWDAVAYCLKRIKQTSITLSDFISEPMALASADDRRRAKDRILAWLKQIPEERRRDFVGQLVAKLDAPLPEGAAEALPLAWKEVRQMAASGIEFGSHSVTHPILTQVSQTQLKAEAVVSKQTIEQELGQEVLAFAYPAGRRDRFNQTVRAMIAQSGYRYALSYDEGMALEAHTDRFALPRIHSERDLSLNLFRANLLFPQLMLRNKQALSAPPSQAAPYSLSAGRL
jgi:peptidoglycan/xylan/chitin deacetylase (PgdA/CDA1 family)